MTTVIKRSPGRLSQESPEWAFGRETTGLAFSRWHVAQQCLRTCRVCKPDYAGEYNKTRAGIPFALDTWNSRFGRDPYLPSLDRIDCHRGYEAGNIRFVLLAINTALNEWGLDTILPIMRALVQGHEPEP